MSAAMDGLYDPTAMPTLESKLKQFGNLWIDVDQLEPVKTLKRWQGGVQQLSPPNTQLGQSKGGPKCNEVPVQPGFVQEVRTSLHSRPFNNCCLAHGDMASKRSEFQTMLKRRPVELLIAGNTLRIQPEWIASTTYFDCYINESTKPAANAQAIRICPSRVCNLHQRQACKYGSDCRNVHLCREVWPQLPVHRNSPPPPPASAPITVLPRHIHPPHMQASMAQGLNSVQPEAPGSPVAPAHVVLQETGVPGPQAFPHAPAAIPVLLVHGAGQQALFYNVMPVLQGAIPFADLSQPPTPMTPHTAPAQVPSALPSTPPKSPAANAPRKVKGQAPKPMMDFSLLQMPQQQQQPIDPWAGNWLAPPAAAAGRRANSVPGLPKDAELSSRRLSSRSSASTQQHPFTRFDLSKVSPFMEDADFEPNTPNAMTAEELSSQADDEFISDRLSGDEWCDVEEQPKPKGAGPLRDLLAQQTIFQSLTFDFLDDVATGIALPVIEELQQAVM